MDQLERIVIGLPGIVAGLALHEYAHAVAAHSLGDDTPRRAGRLTPEPWVHLDPIGTILILLYGFGWGKPVPVNPGSFRDQRKGYLLVAIAGPAANIILAFLFAAGYGFASIAAPSLPVLRVLDEGVWINANLAALNLIPLPPLDGGKVLSAILPAGARATYGRLASLAPVFVTLLMVTGVALPFLAGVSTKVGLLAGLPGQAFGRAIGVLLRGARL